MQNTLRSALILCCILAFPLMGRCWQKTEDINPCNLVAADKIFTIFPDLKKAENQKVGPSSVCNYLDKYSIPALGVSVSQAGRHVTDSFLMLDSGYKIEEIRGLGDEAAIAVQQANPKFGLQEGIAVMHVKKKDISLNFSFFRLEIQQNSVEFEKVKTLAAEILEQL